MFSLFKHYLFIAFAIISVYAQINFFDDDPLISLPFGSIHSPISQMMKNMQNKMKQQMNAAMKPLKTQMNKQRMANGIGGTTVISTGLGSVIVKSNRWYICDGQIVEGDRCRGNLKIFDHTQSPCLSLNYVQNGNFLCVAGSGSSNSIHFSNIDGKITCDTGNGLNGLFSFSDFIKTCGALPWEYKYVYYPDDDDPMKINFSDGDCDYSDGFTCAFKFPQRVGGNGHVSLHHSSGAGNGAFTSQPNTINKGFSVHTHFSYP